MRTHMSKTMKALIVSEDPEFISREDQAFGDNQQVLPELRGKDRG